MLKSIADRPWAHGRVDTQFGTVRSGNGVYQKHCMRLNDRARRNFLPVAGYQLYAKVLAYNLTGDVAYAQEARDILLGFSRSTGFAQVNGRISYNGSNQCALDLSILVPILIDAAILLEVYPQWTAEDKALFQQWLVQTPFPMAAAIARTRNNNWGTASAFAAWAIGHYLIDSGLILQETYPSARSLTPEAAREAHLTTQINMIDGRWRGDSRCDVHGIRGDGGITNELRRGSTGCRGSYLFRLDGSYDYQIKSISHLVYHAEAVRRHMNNQLFQYRRSNSSSLIRKAIHFVINNDNGISRDWKRSDLGVLRLASHVYPGRAICDQLDRSHPNHIVESTYLPFTKLLAPENGC